MKVLCVKWGKKYNDKWVYQLREMVRNNLTIEHEFICMTDRPVEGIDCIPCANHLPTWWSKLGLFQPGILPGKKLYLDLDIVITGNIDGMVKFAPGRLVAPDDFSYSLLNPKQGIGEQTRRLLGGAGTINSSVMLWQDDDCTDIWEQFTVGKMDELHGDQNWITQCMWPDKLTLMDNGWVCSYKYHVQRGVRPAPIVVFHGDPKVTQLSKTDPLRQIWEPA